MMKPLCLLLILANVALFLWEIREGGSQTTQQRPKVMNTPGVATILLAREAPRTPSAALPDIDQDEQTLPQEQLINKLETKPSSKRESAPSDL